MTSSNTPPSGSKTQVQLTSNHPLCSWRGAFPPRQVLQSSLHPNCRATNAPLEQNMWWIIVGRSGKVMSYQHGAGNGEEKRSLFRKDMRLTCLIGIAMFVAAQVFAEPVACIFVSYDQGLYDLSVERSESTARPICSWASRTSAHPCSRPWKTAGFPRQSPSHTA